ncbi:hypothetical protein GC56T2_3516 [Geobacillus sp. C56-T2]|nr:hypothetical protein GC56T2_3516 [Geobacillus sp. C56-T2]
MKEAKKLTRIHLERAAKEGLVLAVNGAAISIKIK